MKLFSNEFFFNLEVKFLLKILKIKKDWIPKLYSYNLTIIIIKQETCKICSYNLTIMIIKQEPCKICSYNLTIMIIKQETCKIFLQSYNNNNQTRAK